MLYLFYPFEYLSVKNHFRNRKTTCGVMSGIPIDPNLIAVESLSNYYKEKCKLLYRKIKQTRGDFVDLLVQGKEAYSNKDYKKAAAFYAEAMEAGNARAMNFLAGMYLSGLGVKKDKEKAYELYKKAAEAGDQLALNTANLLGLIHLPSPAEQWKSYMEEVHEFRKKEKYQEAMHKYVALAGNDEVPHEYQAECMYWIGMMYKLGLGIPRNDKRAKSWLRKAADKNYIKAIDALGLDDYRIACENGHAKATTCIKQNQEYIKSAELLARLAQLFKSEIIIHAKDKTADAKSILAIASMGIVNDTIVDITAKGEDAEEAVRRIINLISSNFSMEDEYIKKMISDGKIKLLKDLYKIEESADDSPEVAYVNGYAKATTYVKHIYGICFRHSRTLSQLAGEFKSDIKVRREGRNYMVDAKSILMIAALAMTKGTNVEIYAEGEDAEEAVKRLAELIYGFES